jgi:hypothetical protein
VEDFSATTTEGDESADLHEQAAEIDRAILRGPKRARQALGQPTDISAYRSERRYLDQRLWAYFAGADRCRIRSAVVILLIL